MCGAHGNGGHSTRTGRCRCTDSRLEGFLQPCLLLLLGEGPSYGYQLMETLTGLGWDSGSPDPGVIYRNLRRMERDGAVESSWDTSGTGPARRLYRLTREGEELLHAWATSVRRNVAVLERFLERYNHLFQTPDVDGQERPV